MILRFNFLFIYYAQIISSIQLQFKFSSKKNPVPLGGGQGFLRKCPVAAKPLGQLQYTTDFDLCVSNFVEQENNFYSPYSPALSRVAQTRIISSVRSSTPSPLPTR